MKAEMKTEVKERPILFSGPMVRAILDGRKTQTRRVVKGLPFDMDSVGCIPESGGLFHFWHFATDTHIDKRCPYGGIHYPWDRLWVREAFHYVRDSESKALIEYGYRATGDYPGAVWAPSIHMPRAASRITLEITNVRVERLGDISEEDAKAEGVEPSRNIWDPANPDTRPFDSYRMGFADLWDKINGKNCPWDSNPWVWVITFSKLS